MFNRKKEMLTDKKIAFRKSVEANAANQRRSGLRLGNLNTNLRATADFGNFGSLKLREP